MVVGLCSCAQPPGREAAPAADPVPRSAPVNIAHRGASAYAPEHTLPAYRLALEMGADYVEQDLQITRDRQLVCLHDATLERTTDVEEVFPDRAVTVETDGGPRRVWPVAAFTLDEVRQLDAGSWFGAEFAGVRVPTLQEAIDLVQGEAGLYMETKDPDTYDALGLAMEEELVRVLAANGLDAAATRTATPIFVQSFSPASLRRLRDLAGDTYPLVQLVGGPGMEGLLTDDGLARVAEYADGVGPAFPMLLADPSRARAIRAAGLELHPYTVRAARVPEPFGDATALMTHLFDELGATGVFTDNPDLFPPAR
jgi:glycerophosphoryl diester phosphodiesterase